MLRHLKPETRRGGAVGDACPGRGRLLGRSGPCTRWV